MVMLLLSYDLVLNHGAVIAHTVPYVWRMVIFSSYFAIAARYTRGVHHYG